MKKLLIHIGYPKTATTTLQEEIFFKLHNLGKINYLGRTVKSSHTKTGKSKFKGKDWVWHFRRYLFLGGELPNLDSILSKEKLNVFSDEDLSFHDFFHHTQFGEPINHEEFPEKLKEIIGKDVEVTLMLSLRNQSDLIFSSYLQKYRFLQQYIGNYSFSDFLKNKSKYLNRSLTEHLSLYDFNKFVNNWEIVFDTKANVFFFEDFVNDKNYFFEQLAKILLMTSPEIIKLTGEKHYRKKDKSKEYIEVGVKELSNVGAWIANFYQKRRFERILEKRHYMRFSIPLSLEKKILYKSKKIKIPIMTITEREKIISIFSESNSLFAQKRGIPIGKMITYGYVTT